MLSYGGYEYLEKKLMAEKTKKKTRKSCSIQKHWGRDWPSISHQTTCEVEDGLHQENWANDVWGSKGNHWGDRKSFSIKNSNYVCLFCDCLRQIYLFCTRFFGGAGITGIVRPSWTSGCLDCCHWASRAPQLCPCCRSRCHHQTIFWISSMNVPLLFLPASWRPTTIDPTN